MVKGGRTTSDERRKRAREREREREIECIPQKNLLLREPSCTAGRTAAAAGDAARGKQAATATAARCGAATS
jgi:hypothetical protein